MKFNFSKSLKKLNGETVPKRSLVGGLGKIEQAEVQKLLDAVQAVGLPAPIVQSVVENALNASDDQLTLGECLITLLLEGVEEGSRTPDGRVIPKRVEPRDKILRGKLAEKLWDGGVVDLTDDERALCKTIAASCLGTELAFVIDKMLDQPLVEPATEPAVKLDETAAK